ncbi:Z1 domain-containing protein [Mycobacterium sp. ZZG]
MTAERPKWADALKELLTGLANGQPKSLLSGLAYFAQSPVTTDDLSAYLTTASENDPTLTQLRLALARWDADEVGTYADLHGSPTSPRSDARRAAVYTALDLGSDVSATLSARAPVFKKPVIEISRKFEPWYALARSQRTSVYWDDYERYLRDTKGWSAEAISALDETTTDVIERLSDPTRDTVKQTKGLVVGYVQSGKTANFTGVVAKAIDAGYRLIIVLTGTIEILRAQTQRRMDMELMGVENILKGQDPSDPQVAKELDYQQDTEWLANRFLRHGIALDQDGVVHIDRVTTHRSDYKRLPQGLTKLKFHKYDKTKTLNDPANLFRSDAYVAVIKKNPAPLRKLIADLKPIQGDLAQLPVLLIDDESDQASVDTTNPSKWAKETSADRQRTTINKLITSLLELCPRAQYVGYTATPFANVFVDPDDERDLFPSDFVLSLQRPIGYMGVQEFHDVGKRWDDEDKTLATSNELAYVRSLVGDTDDDPDRRRAELQEAIDAWVLSGAMKKFRESVSTDSFRHHTMLIHESVKQAEHLGTAEDVRTIWKTSRHTSAAGLSRLQKLYDTDYYPVMLVRSQGHAVPDSFETLKPFIASVIAQMTTDGDPVLIVNSDKTIQDQQKKLDFEAEKVWRILVGGTQLSRGFTVEGLTVSYFRRKAGQADTLMQAGRWFGFRPGYKDLVRLYIRRDTKVDLYEAFEALLLDEEAFREELRQYEGFDSEGLPLVEPRQIPPLVSQHLPWLRPTARNKMWNAVIDSKATAGGIQDRYGLPPRGDAENEGNLIEVGIPLLAAASRKATLHYELARGDEGDVQVKLGTVTAKQFQTLFRRLRWHPQYDEVIKPFTKFLDNATSSGRITEWVVVWPQPQKSMGTVKLEGIGAAPVIRRTRRTGGRIDFVGSDRKHGNAVLGIARGEAIGGLPAADGRGVVLIYLADDRSAPSVPLSTANVVPLLSIAVPKSATPHKRDLIQWTVRVKAQEADAAVDVESAISEHAPGLS